MVAKQILYSGLTAGPPPPSGLDASPFSTIFSKKTLNMTGDLLERASQTEAVKKEQDFLYLKRNEAKKTKNRKHKPRMSSPEDRPKSKKSKRESLEIDCD